METGEILDKLIQNTGLSKTAFTKELNISKSFMLRVMKGEKRLSEAMFTKIISSPIVKEADKDLISHKYFCDVFGENNFNLLLFFLDKLSGFSDSLNVKEELCINQNVLESVLTGKSGPYTIEGCNEFYEFVAYFCTRLLEHEKPFFYSNFSFHQEKLNTILYTVFSKRISDIDFHHAINLTNFLSKYNITTIFEGLKWGSILLNTHYVNQTEPHSGYIFPYCIITNDCVIIFDFDCCQGLIFTQPDMIDYYINSFKKHYGDALPMCNFIEDQLQFLHIDSESPLHQNFSLNGIACLGALLDEYTLNTIARDDLENKDFLINLLLNYYKQYLSLYGLDVYHSKKAITNFASDGMLPNISDKYITSCTKELRARILTKLKNIIGTEDDYRFYLINDKKLELPENVEFHFCDDITQFFFFFSQDSKKHWKHHFNCLLLQIDSSCYHVLFQNMREYFAKDNFLYDNDYIKYFLNNLILENTLSDK